MHDAERLQWPISIPALPVIIIKAGVARRTAIVEEGQFFAVALEGAFLTSVQENEFVVALDLAGWGVETLCEAFAAECGSFS
jgi:hypothetical protein